jgi:hypothetical protein
MPDMRMLNFPSRRSGRSSPAIVGALATLAVSSLLFLSAAAKPPAPAAGSDGPAGERLTAGDYQLERRGFFDEDLPNVTFFFRILNSSGAHFNQLKFSDIGIKFDGQPVRQGMLTPAKGDPVRVIVLIDGSGSMDHGVDGVNKLAAAKAALLPFIDSLNGEDAISVFAFDSRPEYPVSDGGSLGSAKQRVSGFQLSQDFCDGGELCRMHTDLYGAVDRLLDYAGSRKIQNLIIVSDGMQDTREWRDKSESQRAAAKREWEGKLGAKARDNRVRVFTIAIGDNHAAPGALEYVDSETLKRISDGSSDGDHYDEDLPGLLTRAQESSTSYQDLLTEDLKKIFAKARQSISYDYRLDLNLGSFPHDGREHVLEMVFPTGDASSSFPAVRYPLSWRPDQPRPEAAKPEMFRVFLAHPGPAVRPTSIGSIYVTSLGVLGVLAVIPIFYLKAQRASYRRAQERIVASSVIIVQKNSSYVGQTCPNDSTKPISPGDVIVVCPQCGRAHHLGCWVFANSCCMVRNCPAELAIPVSMLEKHRLIAKA